MIKVIYICFIASVTLGIVYQTHFDIDPTYIEYKKEYTSRLKEIRAKEYETYLASLTGWERFKEEIIRLSKIHQFSPNVPIAQCALESARGSSYFAKYRNNFCGIGAFDSDPNKAFSYETPEAHAQAWVRLISRNYKTAWSNRQDAQTMIYHIKAGGYATSPNYVSKVMSMSEFKSL